MIVGVIYSSWIEHARFGSLGFSGIFVEKCGFVEDFESFEVGGDDAAVVDPDDDGFVAGLDHGFLSFSYVFPVLYGFPVAGVISDTECVPNDYVGVSF